MTHPIHHCGLPQQVEWQDFSLVWSICSWNLWRLVYIHVWTIFVITVPHCTLTFLLFVGKGTVLLDLSFKLFEHDRQGAVVSNTYSGPWLIVDNGYLKWSTTIPPIKMNEAERRWSHWCESLQKHVECTFGIFKGRWRIFQTGLTKSPYPQVISLEWGLVSGRRLFYLLDDQSKDKI